jgi:hypothetical protein
MDARRAWMRGDAMNDALCMCGPHQSLARAGRSPPATSEPSAKERPGPARAAPRRGSSMSYPGEEGRKGRGGQESARKVS